MTKQFSDLELLHHIADQVDLLTMSRFQATDLRVDTKPDLTLVSDADQAAERLIRELVTQYRPDDAVHGEEYENQTPAKTQRVWIIDPIDGTNNFVRGVPVWATLLGIQEGDNIIAGLVSAPALGRRWWAQQGHGAFTGSLHGEKRRLRVSGVDSIDNASISYSSLHGWKDIQRENQFAQLLETGWRTRAYGDFWSYMLVAEGSVDIAAEPELALYDMAALVPIVLESGGQFTDVSGQFRGPFGANAVATNGHLHDQVLTILNS